LSGGSGFHVHAAHQIFCNRLHRYWVLHSHLSFGLS
jgi:hypothetical protein